MTTDQSYTYYTRHTHCVVLMADLGFCDERAVLGRQQAKLRYEKLLDKTGAEILTL